MRRAYNLRVPSDNHRSGELSFDPNRTSLNGAGGIGIATFLLGDVTHFARFVSTSTDARERQWRHFYYAQDTWRATPKLTLNYGLRLDVINPQTVNAAGNGGWFDPDTGEILIGGVGGISLAGNVKNHLNWAPRLGATYQLNDKTVIRGGYARTYDIGVFGSLFGHAVTQNLPVLSIQQMNAASNFDDVFNLAQGPPAPTFVTSDTGRFPLPNGVSANVLPFEQRPPEVDAFNIIVQRQLTDSMSFEIGYVANRGRNVFAGRRTEQRHEPADARRLPGRAAERAEAVLLRDQDAESEPRGCVRSHAGSQLLLQLREELVRLDAGALHSPILRRLLCPGQLHPAEGGIPGRRLLLLGSEPGQGRARTGTARTS